MFGKHLIFTLGLAIIAALAAVPASAQNPGNFGCADPGSNSNVNFTFHQPISEVLTNTCANPPATVALGGEIFFEYHCETKANGDFHEHLTSHYNITGVDQTTGIKYVGKDQQSSDI